MTTSYAWDVGTGTWDGSSGADWNPPGDGSVPSSGSDVTVGTGGGGTVTLGQDQTVNSLTVTSGYTLHLDSLRNDPLRDSTKLGTLRKREADVADNRNGQKNGGLFYHGRLPIRSGRGPPDLHNTPLPRVRCHQFAGRTGRKVS
jgi:hypothetical protein